MIRIEEYHEDHKVSNSVRLQKTTWIRDHNQKHLFFSCTSETCTFFLYIWNTVCQLYFKQTNTILFHLSSLLVSTSAPPFPLLLLYEYDNRRWKFHNSWQMYSIYQPRPNHIILVSNPNSWEGEFCWLVVGWASRVVSYKMPARDPPLKVKRTVMGLYIWQRPLKIYYNVLVSCR